MTGPAFPKLSTLASLIAVAAILLPSENVRASFNSADSGGTPSLIGRHDTLAMPLHWYTMFTDLPSDWAHFGKNVFRPETVTPAIGMTILTVGLVAADNETWTLSHHVYERERSVHDVSDFFEYLGDGRPQFGLAAAFGAFGVIRSDQRALRTGSQLVEVILACGTVVQVLKHLTGRESPFVSTVPGGRWDVFPNQVEYHKHVPRFDAYPSGHIATALATVTVVAENYPEWKWVRPVGYSLCALIGISMANTGIHWYSDYPLGLYLGYAFGMIVAHPQGHEATTTDVQSRISIGPAVTSNGPSLGVTIKF